MTGYFKRSVFGPSRAERITPVVVSSVRQSRLEPGARVFVRSKGHEIRPSSIVILRLVITAGIQVRVIRGVVFALGSVRLESKKSSQRGRHFILRRKRISMRRETKFRARRRAE